MCSNSKEDRQNLGKYCKFHKDYDHLTKDCLQFSIYFDKLVCQEEINEYLKESRGHYQGKCQLDTKPTRSLLDNPRGSYSRETRTQKIFNMIFVGGFIGQNQSYSCKFMMSTLAPQQSVKEPGTMNAISFSKDDTIHVMKSHEDPLIKKAAQNLITQLKIL